LWDCSWKWQIILRWTSNSSGSLMLSRLETSQKPGKCIASVKTIFLWTEYSQSHLAASCRQMRYTQSMHSLPFHIQSQLIRGFFFIFLVPFWKRLDIFQKFPRKISESSWSYSGSLYYKESKKKKKPYSFHFPFLFFNLPKVSFI
jgi:hypothetical protein